jgi:hypothetical protein
MHFVGRLVAQTYVPLFFIYLWNRASLYIEVVHMTNKMRQIHNLYYTPLHKGLYHHRNNAPGI